MKHIKKFETLQSANGFVVPKPFVGSMPNNVISNNESAKKIVINGDSASIVDNIVNISGIWNPVLTNNNAKVIISGEVELNGKTDCYSLTFLEGSHLTIKPGTRLRVWEGGITNSDAEEVSYLIFESEAPEYENDCSKFGEFLLHPDITINRHPKAQIKMRTYVGYIMNESTSVWTWHRFSILVEPISALLREPQITAFIYKYDRNSNKWVTITGLNDMYKFSMYQITVNSDTLINVLFKFENNLIGNNNINLTLHQGYNHLGNSFTGKIDIETLRNTHPEIEHLQIIKNGVLLDDISTGYINVSECMSPQKIGSGSIQITLSYKDLVWDPSFKEEQEPTRSLSKGSLTSGNSELPDGPMFKNPEIELETK